MLEKSK